MQKSLVIVESPAKARTIAGFLGDGFIVESSIGHIRDLPRNASEIPSKYKREPWSRLGVNVDNGFQALYVTSPEKRAQVTKLKTLLEKADRLLLATDEDREGESIAWHLVQVLAPKVPIKRMVFHEITPEAIERALKNPRDIDTQLVNAQEARRILDRLYGYEVSPVLWKKVLPRSCAERGYPNDRGTGACPNALSVCLLLGSRSGPSSEWWIENATVCHGSGQPGRHAFGPRQRLRRRRKTQSFQRVSDGWGASQAHGAIDEGRDSDGSQGRTQSVPA